MAIEPKSPRKRAVRKKSAAPESDAESISVSTPTETPEPAKEAKQAKKSVAIPGAIFQEAPVVPKKTSSKKAKPVTEQDETKHDSQENSSSDPSDDGESNERGGRGRRRRRGGRGRRKPGGVHENSDDNGDQSSDEESSEASAESESEQSRARRRRRRRAAGDGVTPGETVEEDGVVTVVKVRQPRERQERNQSRVEARRNRRDRGDRGGRYERESYREPFRRRGTLITETEYIARRDNVDREMLVRQIGDRTQIAVIEDGVMVEHYVNRNSNVSYVGNVYLGRVQNVLPSMEAAFVDIGKGRNAVLYAGEVNWDAAGISESSPRKIEMVLKTGQPVLVQVTKDPIGQKGARLTSQISLPGRYVVYVPGGGMSGISKRLPEPERQRLKNILKDLIPEGAGVIVRTAAEGVSEEELTADVARLKQQWEDIYQKSINPNFHAPAVLYAEPDLAVRVIRDIFNEDFRHLIVQGEGAYNDITQYINQIAPELAIKIRKYSGKTELFSDYRVEEQLAKAFDRKVYLPSGGSLVIDRTEAMVVIDVNTGKFIGKGGNLEETVTKNNLEAAEEIARQLRLRDLGGIVVIDFIDMVLESNREAVLRRLIECLGRDRTKHQVAEVTSLGLVQMTRKRVGQGLIEAFSTTCETCNGRGIHIHTEPVKIKAPMPQLDVPSAQHEDADESDATEHEFHDIINEHSEESSSSETVRQDHGNEKSRGGRRRRRAVSTGVVTPGQN